MGNDNPGTAFLPLLESFGFCHCVQELTHTFNPIPDLVLTFGIEMGHLKVSAQNLLII